MNPSDPRNLLPPPPPLYPATTSSSAGRQEFVNPGIQTIPPMSTYSPPQGYGHIPLNPMPGPPYHKIAQPIQPRESIQSQQSVFQQYTPQQSYPQTHYNQSYPPDQYYPQSGYQQPTYRSPVHSVPQQYLPQHMSYQHSSPTQPQPQLNPQNYDPYSRTYLSNQGTPPGITIPQPQHPLSTNTAFSQVQPQASQSPIQPSGSPLGSFQQRQTASPSRVPPITVSSSSASTLDAKIQNSNFNLLSQPPPEKVSTEKTVSAPEKVPKEKPTEVVQGEVRKAMQDTAQQTDKEQKIQKVKNEAVIARPVAATKPITVAQKKENAKASRAPVAIPGAPKQPPGYHDEKPCEWLVGDLVWSKVSGHPWWPCMVAYDPNLGIYTKMQGGIGRGFRMYHVQFFGEVPERGWVSGTRIRKFEGRNQYEELVKEMIRSVKKKDRTKLQAKMAVKGSRKVAWEVGVQECLKALPMSRHERKLNFTFKYDMPKNKGGTTNSEQIDIVSFGDHPKMKAKRAYKKQKDDSKDQEGEEAGAEKKSKGTKDSEKETSGKKKKKDKSKKDGRKKVKSPKVKSDKEEPRSLRKRGRKSIQFLKFCSEKEEQQKEEYSSLSKKELYIKFEKEWSELTAEERAKYDVETASPRPKKSERKRKREEKTPTAEPVLKRSKREAKPSRKIQESELSNLNFAKRGLKKDSSEPDEDHQGEEDDDAEKVTSPSEKSKKEGSKVKATPPKTAAVSKRGRKLKKISEDQTKKEVEAVPETKKPARKKSRKASLTDEMTRDFEEMQEEAPLVIDTSAITSVLESPSDTNGTSEKGAGSRRASTSTTGKESLRRSSRSRNKLQSTVTGSG